MSDVLVCEGITLMRFNRVLIQVLTTRQRCKCMYKDSTLLQRKLSYLLIQRSNQS